MEIGNRRQGLEEYLSLVGRLVDGRQPAASLTWRRRSLADNRGRKGGKSRQKEGRTEKSWHFDFLSVVRKHT